MCYNDQGEVSGAIVMMLKGANSSEVIKSVKEKIAQIQKTLPDGIEIEPFLDRTKMVNNAIGTVEKNLLEGALIVVFVLVMFLGNFRAGLLVASVIPLAMLFAICMMNFFGVSGNLMSLGALDFGLIVDGAVIIVEAVMHQLSSNSKYKQHASLTPDQMDKTVTSSASKMMNSAVFGQIIILIVYLPIFTLQGIEGKMFKPMAQTVAFALLGAFILSLTYIPMMSAFFLSKKTKHKENLSDKVMKRLENTYQKTLTKVLRFPKAVLGSVLLLFISAVITLTTLGGEFIPALEEGDFAVDTRVLTGSNLNTTIESTQKAAHILKSQFPEVEKVVTKIGSGEVPTDPMPMEASDMMVILKDKKEWTSATTFNELSAKMSKALEDVPGITTGFQFPVQMRFNELMTGARQDVVLKIFGENLDTLAVTANKLGKIISTVDGTANLFIEPVAGMPQVIIDYNRPAIAQHHLSIADINKVINTAFAGQSTGLMFEQEKRFDLVVRLNANERKDIEDIRDLLIPTPSGSQVPLAQLATVEIKNGPNQIQREDTKRRIVVGFNVKDRDVQSIVNELQAKVDKELNLPAGYYVTYGGAFENLNQAKDRLMIAVPVSLLLIFILLFFAFHSVKHGLLIYTAIPLSAIGGIFFLALRGMPFSISAGVGFIALFGVAVLNGIVLIAEFNRLKNNGMKNLVKIVLIGTKSRLRPVLMTAFVASLGFLPMALSNGAGAEVQRPLATVVIGGLLVATFLTLFVLPLLYILFEKGFVIKSLTQKTAFLLIFFTVFSAANAQEKISIEMALKMATERNNSVKNEKLRTAYAQALIKSGADIPKTTIFGEAGQINSAYDDTKFGVSQTIAFPTIYKKQKQLLYEQWKTSVLNTSLKEHETKKAVTHVFYTILYFKEKEKLLQQADTLFNDFYTKANLRLQKGESNILEKTTAENQRAAIAIQLMQLRQEMQTTLLELQVLLNSEIPLVPLEKSVKYSFIPMSDGIENNLLLKLSHQQKNNAVAQTQLEKSRYLPDLTIGYFNNSFKGMGPDNNYYNSSNRFSSIQAGLGIPLFSGSQSAKIKASKIGESIADNEYEMQLQILQTRYKQAMTTYKINTEITQYYEGTGLKNASVIKETANKQFTSGEINFLDFVMVVNQAIGIKSNYLEAVKALNESSIELNFITSN